MIEFYGIDNVYSESGVDLTLLRQNLQRTIEERWENNRRAVEFCRMLDQSNPQAQRPARKLGMFDPAKVLTTLTDAKVEFVVIGGLALRTHGSAHITDDLDVCYRRTPENCSKVADAMAPLHPYMRGVPRGLPFHFDAPTIRAGLNFTLTTDCGDVDFLGEVAGVGNFDQVQAQSVEKNMLGLSVRVLSIEGLIAAKKAANRPKDRIHLADLEELKKLRDADKEP
jgi:hypothetical protein